MWNFKSRLYLLILVTTLPFILYLSYTQIQNLNDLSADTFNRLTTVSTLTAAEHKQITEGARQLLIALSATPIVITHRPVECADFLAHLKNNYVRYLNFGVVNLRGDILCAADPAQALANPPSSTLIKQTLTTQNFTIGSYYGVKPAGAVINFAYPLAPEQIVYASLSLDWVADFVKNLNLTSPGLVTNILDKNGTVLARNPTADNAIGQNFAGDPLVQEILTKGEGQTTKVGIDHVLRLYAFSSLDDSHSTFIAVGIPQSTIYNTVRESLISSLVIIFLIILLSFFLAEHIGQHLLIKQMESLQKLDKLKDEFVSLASHQLRSPMTAIRWLTESLLDSTSPRLTPTQKSSLTKIHVTTLRLITLTSTLLNISRLQSGTLNPRLKTISLLEIISPILLELKLSAKNSNVKLKSEVSSLSFITDPFLLHEIVYILLDNAIAYSTPKSIINLRCMVNDHGLKLTVTNSGVGISPDSSPHIFTRFYRASNARAVRPSGNGLGLYLARLITTKLGGTLTFISHPGKLTTFTLQLPK
jgi:signal transduction histidine kinase